MKSGRISGKVGQDFTETTSAAKLGHELDLDISVPKLSRKIKTLER